jgi:Fe-S-cluster-containing dehydrogenase component/anaerobic selenocysteine-containing dehydrogenase
MSLGDRPRAGKERSEPRVGMGFADFVDPHPPTSLPPEFPDHAEEWTDPVTRREFLTLMGASFALAGVTGCSTQPAPRGEILPYSRQPENLTPGQALRFATTMTLAGMGMGVLVESHEGRPTKVAGNPDHPASKGATDAFAQASVLGLYDPDRSKTPTFRGRPRTWSEALAAIRSRLRGDNKQAPPRLRILTGTVGSPSLGRALVSLEEEFAGAKWVQYEPISRDALRNGAQLAFGRVINTYYDLDKAQVVLSLDADFLASGPGCVRYTRDFSTRRRVRAPFDQAGMNRLYVVESMPSCTGAVADHRLPVLAGQIEAFTQALASAVGVRGLTRVDSLPGEVTAWLEPVARDLQQHAGRCVVIPGEHQPARVHALVHLLNQQLENGGKTVWHTRAIETRPTDEMAKLRELVTEMEQGQVDVLLILGANPVYDTPVDLDFARHLEQVPFRVHLGLYQDETAIRCDWHLAEAHYLESWGDARAYEGTPSLVQPLIQPLYGGRSALEVVDALRLAVDWEEYQPAGRPGLDIVREYWQEQHKQQGQGDFEAFWQQGLQKGVLPREKEYEPQADEVARDWLERISPELSSGQTGDLELVFRPDPGVHDGRFANNGWLQELPRPLTRLTWDNAAFLSPKTAEDLGISFYPGSANQPATTGGEHGQGIAEVVKLQCGDRSVQVPAWIIPGHADGSITLNLGFGRHRAGRVGTGVGVDAYQVRTSHSPWVVSGVEVARTGATRSVACVQMHHRLAIHIPADFSPNRKPLVRQTDLATLRKPESGGASKEDKQHEGHRNDSRLHPLTLYTQSATDFSKTGQQWGMVIDLSTCTGCSACVVACQAENNIPVVGRTEVMRGREMHWLRIDHYFQGKDVKVPAEVKIYQQPVPCMQCENAPCEVVCPVEATVHSQDGLNDMVYNRCVGTRYCSNNCPYKVRRFNFLAYSDYDTLTLKLGRNPEVTVRSRGVMEKCTYCVQRIRRTEIAAERENREIREGEIQTACQEVCPAQAIVFGDLNQNKSEVSRLRKEEDLHYSLLEELNTNPRTTYLKAVGNPNPEMPQGK